MERIKMNRGVILAGLAAALLAGGYGFRDNIARFLADVDHAYHGRNASAALIQFAPDPRDSATSGLQYIATFENRSGDPLVITHLNYEFGREASASASAVSADGDADYLGNVPALYGTRIYEADAGCAAAGRQPLVPSFEVPANAAGAFRVRLSTPASNGGVTCEIAVSFETNQGTTNQVIVKMSAIK